VYYVAVKCKAVKCLEGTSEIEEVILKMQLVRSLSGEKRRRGDTERREEVTPVQLIVL